MQSIENFLDRAPDWIFAPLVLAASSLIWFGTAQIAAVLRELLA